MTNVTRRLTMAAGAAALALPAGRAAAQEVRGRVHADGAGLAGVMVSNGRDVAVTAADGSYRLGVFAGDSVFVIKPAGYAIAADPATRLPAHALAATWPDMADFALRRQDEPDRFDALLFADPQPESLAELGYFRDTVVAAAAAVPAAFGITHGDLMSADLSFYDRYNRIVGAIGLPWYSVPGNHDIDLAAPDDASSRETFRRVFGTRTAAFQYAGVTVLLLDNVEYFGRNPAAPNGAGRYRGRFGAGQLGFVRAVLAHVPRESLVVISHHIPLRTQAGTAPSLANTDTREFLAAISTHPNTVSFSGHTHTNEHWYIGAEDGYAAGGTHHHHVLAAASGSWWSGPFDERGLPVAWQSDGSPNGFHVLSVDGVRYTTRLVPARESAQMRIVLESLDRGGTEVIGLMTGPVPREAAGSTRLVVNLFDGGPRSRVSMTVGRGPAVELARTLRRDPFVGQVYARNMRSTKPWVRAGVSTHVWQVLLPADLPPGTHCVTVTAADEHGRPQTGSMVLEVT